MATSKTCCKTSRSDLLSLLSQACEFEHGLACSYLFTSFTLKQEINEGLTWQQQQLTRRWAADIFVVAAEEMLHLAQVWNLIAAVGGNPYYWRPNFPVASNYYPTGLPIALSPFKASTIARFVQYELPDTQERHAVCEDIGISPVKGEPEYGSVSQLYSVVREIVESMPEDELFIGNKAAQVGEELVDFPSLIKVVDRDSAVRAIDLIKEQGEGAVIGGVDQSNDPQEAFDVDRDGHYGVFRRILMEFKAESERATNAGEPFEPARNVIENPVAVERSDDGVRVVKRPSTNDEHVGHLIQDPFTQQVAELFDSTYLLMLQLLQYVFRNSTDDTPALRNIAKTAIGLMPTLIKPLAESLTLLPAGKPFGDKTAGPTFGLSRHVTLPEHPRAATIIVRERLQELANRADVLANNERAPAQLVNSLRNLRVLQNNFSVDACRRSADHW